MDGDLKWERVRTKINRNAQRAESKAKLTGAARIQASIINKNGPGPIAHHSTVVYGKNMYLFGGSNGTQDNKKFYKLDLNTFTWDILEEFKKNSLIQSRDSHTAVVCSEIHNMYIFGGFCKGQRTNEVYIYNFNTRTWTTNHREIMSSGYDLS